MKPSFWLTNISKINISLSDLNVVIRSGSTVNLLDKAHYNYTLEELQKCAVTGSISKRRGKLFVRVSEPDFTQKNTLVKSDDYLPSRQRSIFSIKEQHYEELQISDEDFAAENADIADVNTDIKKG